MTEDVIREFILNFNKDFKSNIPTDLFNFLKDIYENTVGPEITNEFEQQYMDKLECIVDELYKSFNKCQRELFDKFDRLKNKIQNNTEQQLFIYGFCTAKLLDKIENAIIK